MPVQDHHHLADLSRAILEQLPREIRDKVYAYVWDFACPNPLSKTSWNTPAANASNITKSQAPWTDTSIVGSTFARELVESLYTVSQHSIVHPDVNNRAMLIVGKRSTLKNYLETDAFEAGITPADVPLQSLRIVLPVGDNGNREDILEELDVLRTMKVRKGFSLRIIYPKQIKPWSYFYRPVWEDDVLHISGLNFYVDADEQCYKEVNEEVRKVRSEYMKKGCVVFLG